MCVFYIAIASCYMVLHFSILYCVTNYCVALLYNYIVVAIYCLDVILLLIDILFTVCCCYFLEYYYSLLCLCLCIVHIVVFIVLYYFSYILTRIVMCHIISFLSRNISFSQPSNVEVTFFSLTPIFSLLVFTFLTLLIFLFRFE